MTMSIFCPTTRVCRPPYIQTGQQWVKPGDDGLRYEVEFVVSMELLSRLDCRHVEFDAGAGG